MLKPEIENALNTQLNWEQTAAQEYLAMAAWFEDNNLGGFARFMRKQVEEEMEHAMRLFDYIFARGGRVRVGAIVEPPGDYDSPLAVFEAARRRERSNTE
ncbi:MAG: ferritin, partial [Planctomycetota bacterium]